MKINRTLTVALLVAATLAIHARVARADFDVWGKTTKVTFASDVQVPGTVLPTGTYVFKLFDSPNDRHIVQIYNADQTKLITTVVAVPDYKLEVSGRTVFNFEGGLSEPVAIESWFYPGDNMGQHFVYSKAQEEEFAAERNARNSPEVATASEPPAPLASPTPLVEDATTKPAPIAEPPAASEPSAAVNTEPQNTAEPQNSTSQGGAEQLPHTASYLPLIGLSGVFLTATALILRIAARA